MNGNKKAAISNGKIRFSFILLNLIYFFEPQRKYILRDL